MLWSWRKSKWKFEKFSPIQHQKNELADRYDDEKENFSLASRISVHCNEEEDKQHKK